jgi:hypothetical protein
MEVFNATFCHYAPINVNPEGGGSGKGGGFDQSGGPMSQDLD